MISRALSRTQRSLVGSSATKYLEQLWGEDGAEALDYLLNQRGLSEETVGRFGLGYVAIPEDEHGNVAGRICIPYFDLKGVTALRFRGLPGREGHAKYLDLPGAKPLLYNVTTLADGGDELFICEGEIDVMTAHQMGLPTVGLSGAQKWQRHYRNMLSGYGSITVLADSDDGGAGLELGQRVRAEMPDAAVRIKPSPEGHDVNSAYLALGRDALFEHWGISP